MGGMSMSFHFSKSDIILFDFWHPKSVIGTFNCNSTVDYKLFRSTFSYDRLVRTHFLSGCAVRSVEMVPLAPPEPIDCCKS